MARDTEDPIVSTSSIQAARTTRNLAIQVAFIGMAALAVYGFVSAAQKDQLRALCSATCALMPDYAGRNRLAPDFELKDTEGKPVRLSSYRGKTVVMNFWSWTCKPCMHEMPALARLALALEGRDDVVFLTINIDDEDQEQILRDELMTSLSTDPNLDSEVKKRLETGKLPFPILRDPETSVTKAMYGTQLVPETWIIDPKGYVRARFDGPREWDGGAARRAIDAVAQGPGCLADFRQGKASGRYAKLCDPE